MFPSGRALPGCCVPCHPSLIEATVCCAQQACQSLLFTPVIWCKQDHAPRTSVALCFVVGGRGGAVRQAPSHLLVLSLRLLLLASAPAYMHSGASLGSAARAGIVLERHRRSEPSQACRPRLVLGRQLFILYCLQLISVVGCSTCVMPSACSACLLPLRVQPLGLLSTLAVAVCGHPGPSSPTHVILSNAAGQSPYLCVGCCRASCRSLALCQCTAVGAVVCPVRRLL